MNTLVRHGVRRGQREQRRDGTALLRGERRGGKQRRADLCVPRRRVDARHEQQERHDRERREQLGASDDRRDRFDVHRKHGDERTSREGAWCREQAPSQHDDERRHGRMQCEILGVRQPGCACTELAIDAEGEECEGAIEPTGAIPPGRHQRARQRAP